MKYVALDVETANSFRGSLCSIGMVKVIDGQITDKFYTLIDPEEIFSTLNIGIHGIYPKDVEGFPTFPEVLPEIKAFIGASPIVAHFAQFDMYALRDVLSKYSLPNMNNHYFCSYAIARQTLKIPSYRLNHLMNYFQIPFQNHHHALADAEACAHITNKLLAHYDHSLEAFLQIKGYKLGSLNGKGFIKGKKLRSRL